MEMGAQFMYISRLPILLNQVQASVALPFFIPVGSLKSYDLTHSVWSESGSEQCRPSGRPMESVPISFRLPAADAGQLPM